MRFHHCLAALCAAGAVFASAGAVSAGDLLHGYRSGGEDPYAYRYHAPRYYPYVNSGYWVPREAMRNRYRHDTVLPHYQAPWGYPFTGPVKGKTARHVVREMK
jgi:hypothetical protein